MTVVDFCDYIFFQKVKKNIPFTREEKARRASLNILFPFCCSAVAYAVALGLFLAVGKEATGQIPKGKVKLIIVLSQVQFNGWLAVLFTTDSFSVVRHIGTE